MTHSPAVTADKPVPLGWALVVMGVILLGGAGLIGYYLYRPGRPVNVMRVTTPSPGNPRVAGGPVSGAAMFNAVQTAAEAELPDGVHPGAGGDTLFKAGDAYLRAIPQPEGQPRYSFGYFTVSEIEWEHGYLTQGIRRMVTQEDFAKEMGVTADQKKQLEELPESPPAKWPQADRERFIGLYKAWAAASGDAKNKAGEELLKGLRAYGEVRRAADQKSMTDRVTRAKAILNEKQIARINPIPKWDVSKTTQPVGK